MGYIYLITNKVNGKRYVGQTIHEDIETRWTQHRKMKKTMLGRYIYNAYVKHGINNFDFKIICICFDEDCNFLEEEYIQKFNTLAPNGYNLREGGKNSRHHEESKRLMSENRRGKGRGYMTEEIRQSRIGRFAGERNPNYGKKLTDEQRKLRSENMKRIWEEKKKNGFTSSPKLLEALAKGRQKRLDDAEERRRNKPKSSGKKSKVMMLDEYGTLFAVYDSIEDAVKANPTLLSSKISAVCRGLRKSTGGYIWKYANEDHSENRNKTTGEQYISKQGSGFMLRISKKTYHIRKWFKTLEEAVKERDNCVLEIDAQKNK